MKKILFLMFLVVVITSCSSNDDTSNSNIVPNISSSPYNPPAWIHGKWGIKANGTTVLNDNAFYLFSSDNVCQLLNGTSFCWKEAIAQFPTLHSGNDISTSITYTANFIGGNGAQIVTISFEKISATKILWVNTSSGVVELEKLN